MQHVEIIYLGDNKSMSVGEKRNLLLYISRGEYVCFVDDDDQVADNYVSTILKNIEGKPDVYSFDVMQIKTERTGAVNERLMIHSIRNGKNYRDKEKNVMMMIPNHLSVIKREIAIKEQFPHKNLAEDHQWADGIQKYLKSEQKTSDVLYYYHDNKDLSETRKR